MFRFATVVQRFGLALAVLIALVADGFAQQAPLIGIEPVRVALDQIEAATRRGGLGVRGLTDLSQRLAPLREDLRDKAADLEPRLADFDARLKGLGPAPAKDAPEDPAIAAERARLTQQRAEIDAAIKQVQLLQTRAEQLTVMLAERRRSAYAETLFRRSPSVLDPLFWRDVIAAAPDYAGRVRQFGQDWSNYARERGGAARMASAVVALTGLLVVVLILMRWWRRTAFVARVGARYGKALAALLVFLRRALSMPLAVLVILALLHQFDLIPANFARLTTSLVIGVAIASLARAAATSVLAPDDPARRLVSFDDATAHWLFAHLTWGGRIFGAFIALRALHRTAGAPLAIDDATRMLFAAIVAALLIHLLTGRREADEEEARRIPGMRLLAWIVVAAIAVSLLAGYASFAAFVAGRVVFTVTLIATLHLLLVVTDAVINRTLSAESPGGRKLARQLGIEPRRLGLLGKLTSGIVRALFVLVILALAVGRWEVAAADLFEAIKGVALGVRIGDFTISFGAVFGAIVLFLIVVGLTRLMQRWLEKDVMPHTAFEPSLRLSIVTILGYVGFIVAIVAALGELGIDPQKIALVAGALSVGIGFGLQSIVSNFVSGLILLAERPIRIGDQIVVKGDEGFVRRISVRATEIETFERASVIIPNSELITGVVKNWTHGNTLGRLNIRVSVSYDCDPDRVMEILSACVAENPGVLKEPPPAVQLTEFAASGLVFDVFCIVPNLAERGRIKSAIQVAILRRFRAAGIDMTPAQDVRLIGDNSSPSSLPGRREAARPGDPA
ncbi:MAG: mechanosensitive ion channel family protein [Alphaproteobacteria bacterium]|nr:MAG: mechanosensitive ion channel family protein [Alphaproteobacteria bacterium]